MSKTKLFIYPNCSLGGMGTVFQNRIKDAPADFHWLFFQQDFGAKSTFEKIPNAAVRIVRKDRFPVFVEYAVQNTDFDEICITSMPSLVPVVRRSSSAKIVYEFHTSTESVIASEIDQLRFEDLDEIWVPSNFLRDVLQRQLQPDHHGLVRVNPNLVDKDLFSPISSAQDFAFGDQIPLIWVGRFDLGKNPRDFLRILAELPSRYVGIFILSLENDPTRADDFFSEAFTLNVSHRIRFLLNLRPQQMAQLYRYAARKNGAYCSTSLGESFGYTIAEAIRCGLHVVAYDVGAIAEQKCAGLDLVDVGDMDAFKHAVLKHTERPRAVSWRERIRRVLPLFTN